MDATELAMIVLSTLCVLLTCGLVAALYRVSRLADKCINHALAESAAQREIMRLKFEAEHQELLLREARAREARDIGRPRPAQPEGRPDILVTSNGTLNE